MCFYEDLNWVPEYDQDEENSKLNDYLKEDIPIEFYDPNIVEIREAAREMYEYYMVPQDVKVGDEVYDDLTKEICIILQILVDEGGVGYQINSSWLDGYRFPWELSNPKCFNSYIPKNIILGYD